MSSPIQQFRLPAEMKAELDRLAAKGGIPVSDVIKMCIKRALPYVEGVIDGRIAAQPPQS